MKSNPGGQLAPEQIVGRDELITKMWGILEGQSVYMNDLRRIGKTQIMVKMHSAPPPEWVTVKCDLGGLHTAAEFATQAYRMSHEVLSLSKRSLRRMTALLGKTQGIEIAGVIKLPDGTPAPWKEVLRRTFADIEEAMVASDSHQRMVFFWDEVPFLLDNISKREGPDVAMEVFDALRSLGQDHDHIRLLLTGSIGLHHVLGALNKEGYKGSPLNRMELVQPGPLASKDARQLAKGLLIGDDVKCSDVIECSVAIADLVGNVSFYIHKLVSRLPRNSQGETVTVEKINAILVAEITSDNNDWDFEHYRNRLNAYYGEEEELALKILDSLAVTEEMSFDTIRNEVASQMQVNSENLRALLKLLCRDHYLARNPSTNNYRFYLGIIRRWWALSRHL